MITESGDYWVDENDNRWYKKDFTKKMAEIRSLSLVDCYGCSGCARCYKCRDCRGCKECTGCNRCFGCSGCFSCSDCEGCQGCFGCVGFKQNPQRIYSSEIGSRLDQTRIYWTTKDDVQVVCGCLKSNLPEFKAKVLETYPEGRHHDEYMEFISKVEQFIGV